jgi:hypothetical protein
MPLALRQPKRVNALGQVTEEVLGDRAVGAHLVLLRGHVRATGGQTLVAGVCTAGIGAVVCFGALRMMCA